MNDRHPRSRSSDRRRQQQFTDLGQVLDVLPARVLLDRMPGPVIGVDPDGVVAYANPAVVALLGYVDGALLGRTLLSLLARPSLDSGAECVTALRTAGGGDVVDWCHSEGFPVHTLVSSPLLLRASDPFLMVSITDVTELHWSL